MSASPATATGTSSTTESGALSGLTPGTEYYFQIEATNSAGTTYGSVLNFTTPAAAPTATTNAATSVSGTGATLNGSVNAEGASTTVTYCYSTSSSLSNCVGGTVTTVNGSTTPVTGNTNTAETAALTGLTPNTEYFFQIKAVNSVGTTYGAVLNFTTRVAPAATTSAASGTTATTSTLNGSVNAENASTTVSFCYSTSSLTNCSGATTVSAPPGHGHGHLEHRRDGRAERPDARHRVLLPDRGDQQRRHHLWLGAQLHHPGGGPHRHDERGHQRQRHGGDPQRLGQRRGGLDHGHLLLQHLELLTSCVGGTVTTVNGSTPTVTGTSNTAETAALTGLTPNTEYFFQIKAVNSVGTTYGAVLNFTTLERPAATTSAASGTTATTSTLNGTVNAENASTTVSFCYSTSSLLANCSGATTVAGSTPTVTGTSNTAETGGAERPDARHRVLLPDRGDQQRRHHLRLGAQLHHLGRGPKCHDERGDQRQRHGGDPQRLGQRQGGLDHSHLLLQHLELQQLLGRTVTTVTGQPQTVTGSDTAETAALTGLTPNTEYFFQIKATNSVGTTYGAVLNFTTTLSPGRHHERGQRHHRHDHDPQWLGQRGERLDRGQLLLQHHVADQLHGRDRHYRERLHHPGDGHFEHRRDGGAQRPGTQHQYYFQIEATNSAGTTYGSVLNFRLRRPRRSPSPRRGRFSAGRAPPSTPRRRPEPG